MSLSRDQLSFSCTRCGWCCRGPGGFVRVLQEDLEQLCTFLSMDTETFGKKYLRRMSDGDFSIIDGPNGDCVFLEGNHCKVYAARPEQCRTWPWWDENVESEKAWAKASARCPGIKK